MASKINEVDVLQEYIKQLTVKSDHHAKNVNEIIFPLIGTIVWKKTGDMQVLERDGEIKNVLWVYIGSKKYAFSYNHNKFKIEMREKSIKGKVLFSFDNNTNVKDIVENFSNL